jgi:hypothetical protein
MDNKTSKYNLPVCSSLKKELKTQVREIKEKMNTLVVKIPVVFS